MNLTAFTQLWKRVQRNKTKAHFCLTTITKTTQHKTKQTRKHVSLIEFSVIAAHFVLLHLCCQINENVISAHWKLIITIREVVGSCNSILRKMHSLPVMSFSSGQGPC